MDIFSKIGLAALIATSLLVAQAKAQSIANSGVTTPDIIAANS